MKTTHLETSVYYFKDDGMIPNNPDLPVILYPGALRGEEQNTEEIFNKHNWRNSWTGSVFPYHHYHSNSHEVLGVIKGSVKLHIGGEKGIILTASAGDILVLPAGTGHKKLESSLDFRLVGAYPDGMSYNTHKGGKGERPEVLHEIARVPLPDQDPLLGAEGPLLVHWKKEEKPN
ncbi:cupin domain-containing protein [Paenibacillus gallinarum]|uniref:Cupin domain-containing protein n=1 Tax=Paenibacillus gallinarum TaxID=2762232 RepID=A0ABR8T2K2_9BACL|nr:cupin domain-containing protein [Paenibacillus gallinarum]MBD7969993.1 cupin domain-containing protein [Paenibacillus gallinarum]